MAFEDTVSTSLDCSDESQEVLFDFTVMLLEDLGAGEVRSLDEYQRRFPGHEAAIVAEFESICFESPGGLQSSLDLMEPEPRYLLDLKIGNYQVERELGRGGQATVYVARDTRMQRNVALKVLSSSFGRIRNDQMERFRREADAIASIDHPCICDVFEVDFESDPPFIAMRLVNGKSFRKHVQLAQLMQVEGRGAAREESLPCFPKDEEELFKVLRVFERLANALHAAHVGGVIHRDVKPANLVLDPAGTPVILDFGLARVGGEDTSTLTMTGEVFGTPAYMPPELLRGRVDQPIPSLDVYSLAVTLYECLTLKRPFEGGTPEAVYNQILNEEAASVLEHHPALPSDVAVVLSTALEKDLNLRYSTAQDFAEELRRICEREPIKAIPAGPILRLKRWMQRHPALGTSLVGSLLILVVGLGVSLYLLEKVATERDSKEDLFLEVAEERDRKEQLIDLYKATYFRETAQMKLSSDPVHALLLANEAYRREPVDVNHREVWRAMSSVYEESRVNIPFSRNSSGMGFIQTVAPHPSRPWVLYNDIGNSLWFHDLETGSTREVIVDGGESDGMRVSFDPTGDFLLVSRNYGDGKAPWFEAVEVRSPDGAEVLQKLSVAGEKLSLHDQRAGLALTSCTDGRDLIWDVASGALVSVIEREGTVMDWGAFSGAADRLVFGLSGGEGRDSSVEVLEIKRGGLTEVVSGASSAAAWNTSGDRLFLCTEDGGSLWSFPGAELVDSLPHETGFVSGSFSEDGESLVTIAREGEVFVWDGRTGAALRQLVGHDDRAIVGAKFNRSAGSSHLFATTCYDQTIRIWNVDTEETVRVYRGLHSRPTGSWWDVDSDRFMCVEEHGFLHVWRPDTQAWPKVFRATEGEIERAQFVGGGERVAVVTDLESVEVLDWRSGELVAQHQWSDAAAEVSHVDSSRVVAVGSAEGGGRVLEWSLDSGLERAIAGVGPTVVNVIAYGEDDSRFLLHTADGELEAWDFMKDQSLYSLTPSEKRHLSIETLVSPSGELIVTGVADGYARLWDAADGALMRELGPFKSRNGDLSVRALLFSADEEELYVANGDACIRRWSLESGEMLGVAASHTAAQIGFFDEDHLFLSAQYTGNLVVFDLNYPWPDTLQAAPSESREQLYLGTTSGSSIAMTADKSRLLFCDSRSPLRLLDVRYLLPVTEDSDRAVMGSFSMDLSVEPSVKNLSEVALSPDDELIVAVGGGKAWIWPMDTVTAATELAPVGIDFFGGYPSLSLPGELER